MSCNDFYTNEDTNIYEYIFETGLGNIKSLVVLILEKNWIVNMLFKNFIKLSYGKTYEAKHKKTKHIIISNK